MWYSENDRIKDKLIEVANTQAVCIASSKHASCIVHKKRILSFGWNKKKSHPICVEHQDNPERIFLHAEMDAIVRAVNLYGSDILSDSDLYVLRVTKGGRLGYSKPCNGCMSVIRSFKIRNVFWS